jgi:hypothetical protein
VTWLARRWPALPPIERALLAGGGVADATGSDDAGRRPDDGGA